MVGGFIWVLPSCCGLFFCIQQVKAGGDCLFCCGIVDNNSSDFFLTSDELGYQSSPNQINGSL
jgi:hypothetical protein